MDGENTIVVGAGGRRRRGRARPARSADHASDPVPDARTARGSSNERMGIIPAVVRHRGRRAPSCREARRHTNPIPRAPATRCAPALRPVATAAQPEGDWMAPGRAESAGKARGALSTTAFVFEADSQEGSVARDERRAVVERPAVFDRRGERTRAAAGREARRSATFSTSGARGSVTRTTWPPGRTSYVTSPRPGSIPSTRSEVSASSPRTSAAGFDGEMNPGAPARAGVEGGQRPREDRRRRGPAIHRGGSVRRHRRRRGATARAATPSPVAPSIACQPPART